MLKQILRDMYIDPEILAGLDENQKQTLFCKMREEQIRRWRIYDQKYDQLGQYSTRASLMNKKSVNFRLGEDGEPWVWIMGEHPDDKTIDEILTDEAKQKARKLAELETKELRKSYEAELSEIIEYEPTIINGTDKTENVVDLVTHAPDMDSIEIYCSVDELRERINQAKVTVTPKQPNNFKQLQNIYNSRISNFNISSIYTDQHSVLKEISNKPSQKVSARIAQWEKRVIAEKTNEIYRRMQKKQLETAKEAEEAAKQHEHVWQEQQRRAKEAENQIREIARRAREEHRKSLTEEQINTLATSQHQQQQQQQQQPVSLDSSLIDSNPRPANQQAVVTWYRDNEFVRGCAINMALHRPYPWFYGLVSRQDAEQLLQTEASGTFLVRLSEKIWGYAISYKDKDRCKHYLVESSNGTYQFLGQNQIQHDSLSDLIEFHSTIPITALGNELLIRPCSSMNASIPKIFDGLIFN